MDTKNKPQMTRQEAEAAVTKRWEYLELDKKANPNVFRCDVDNMLSCNWVRFYDGSPHAQTCPIYEK